MSAPFALVDCNNFYASCDRLSQPELRDKPLVVLSNNDGCVIARSNEAKALRIEMGVPWHLARERFERLGVIVRSSNYTLYGDLSARVMRVLGTFTPEFEVYSIDEAFFGLRGFPDLEAHARTVRAPSCSGQAFRCRSGSRRQRPWPPSSPTRRQRKIQPPAAYAR